MIIYRIDIKECTYKAVLYLVGFFIAYFRRYNNMVKPLTVWTIGTLGVMLIIYIYNIMQYIFDIIIFICYDDGVR